VRRLADAQFAGNGLRTLAAHISVRASELACPFT